MNNLHLFYLPDIKETSPVLPEEEARHALKVLRLKSGDEILATDGKGNMYRSRIEELSQKKASLKIVGKEVFAAPSPILHLAVSPTKNTDRLEWMLEKATEIGIQVFTPVICEHSERKIQKTDRLLKIAISALKQSQQAWIPQINEPVTFKDFIAANYPGQKFIAHCHEGDKPYLKNVCSPAVDTIIMIGPEGDFSRNETDLALKSGFKSVSLGEKRLRTETAGLVALHTAALVNLPA